MNTKIKININILPFGSGKYMFSGGSAVEIDEENSVYNYIPPESTNIESMEFNFLDDVSLVTSPLMEIEEE